jgi:hypothetical protein
MGTLYIIETSDVDTTRGDHVPVHRLDISNGFNCTQLATTTASARQQLDADTRYVTIKASEDMYIEYGGSAVEATTTDYLLSAGETFSFAVRPSSGNYIAAEDVS